MLCYKKVSLLTWCLFVRYCECFQEQQFCDGCNCSNCGNIVGNEKARQEAINAIVQRNPLAFQPKIENGPSTHNVRKVPSSTRILNNITRWFSHTTLSKPSDSSSYVSYPWEIYSS